MSQLTYTKATPAPAPLAARSAGTGRLRRRLGSVARHVILAVITITFMVPFYWMLISAVKDKADIFTVPIQWWPRSFHFENFIEAANYPGFPFLRFLWNSIFYAGTVTIGTVLSCACVGYGFARLRFPGRDGLFVATLATLMIPTIVTFIPTFILFKSVGLLGSYAPLIAPSFFGSGFFIFMMRQFFQGLPAELADAARVDGANEFRIFYQIMLPLVQPALLVMAVFTFLWTWHEFFQPLIYLSDSAQYPLSLGLFAFRTRRLTEWHLMMAGATLTTLPLIVIFFFTQRYFLEGIKMTGLKG
jgi:multiple sugar transport system permease protein